LCFDVPTSFLIYIKHNGDDATKGLNTLSVELNTLDVTIYNKENLIENETFNEVKMMYNVSFHAVQAVSAGEKCVLSNQGQSFAIVSKQMRRRQSVNESYVKKEWFCMRSAV